MLKCLILLLCWGITIPTHAFPCFITLIKDNCWTNYNVVVNVSDPSTEKELLAITVPKGKSWVRQGFTCQPKQALSLVASFTPVFWKDDAGKTYRDHRNWALPEEISRGDTAWNINVCYPADFSSVPLPPDAGSDCKCKLDDIPPIKPQ